VAITGAVFAATVGIGQGIFDVEVVAFVFDGVRFGGGFGEVRAGDAG
jgi:hypothetical protein